MDDLIAICQKYSEIGTSTGVRDQIYWMKQLYGSAVQGFVSHLGIGDALLLSILKHEDINTALMKSSFSMGDINRVIASQIFEGADGYADVDAIAKATGLKVDEVRDIIKRIAAGSITEKTIENGKSSSQFTNRGAYLKSQALKQEKVYEFLASEVERMVGSSDSLNTLYDDLGEGYVKNLLSGQKLDNYQVILYKEHLAKLLDDTLESKNPYSLSTYDISKTDAYKVTKKTRSALSDLINYENEGKADFPEELRKFLTDHMDNNVLSEKEAREYLILCGAYEKGEHGIGEAAKQLSKGYTHLKKFEKVLDSADKALSTMEKAKKVDELIEYWATDYAQQEILLEYLVSDLTQSGADAELMVAARELKKEYDDKLSGTFDKVYSTLTDKGIGAVKSAFPPLAIAESFISVAGIISGSDDYADALEKGLAMQGICKEAIGSYEDAVIAVSQGDTSEGAVSRVLSTFELARQSLVSYYESMVQLTEDKTEKNTYEAELKKLKSAQFGYVTVSPFSGGGSSGGR